MKWIPILAAVALAQPGCTYQYENNLHLSLSEDDSLPCLGGKRLQIQINMEDGVYLFDYFGDPILFDLDSFSCQTQSELQYDNLELHPPFRVDAKVMDSTTGPAEEHILACGSTEEIADASSEIQAEINLSRRPEVQSGTAFLDKPGDWEAVQRGVYYVEFTVYQESHPGDPVRHHQLAFDRVKLPDPFPLVISNLPARQTGELFKVRIDALDWDRKPIRAWYGDIYLQASTIAWIDWND